MQGKLWRHRAHAARVATALIAACAFATVGTAASATTAPAATRAPRAAVSSNIYNTNATKCLGNNGKGQSFLWHCIDKSGSNQSWHLGHEYPGASYYAQLINGLGQCLGVLNHSKKNGASVVVGRCQGTSDKTQYWAYDATWLGCGCGYGVEIINLIAPAVATAPNAPHGVPGTLGMVLGVRDNAKGNGARVVLQKNTIGIGGIKHYAKGQAWYASWNGGT
jgi:hypothetical protein